MTPELSAHDAKHVRATNIIAAIGGAVIGLWAPMSWVAGERLNALENLFASACFASAVWLNRRGHRATAAGVLLATAHLQVLWALYFFGFESGSALFYSVTLMAPYFTMPARARRAAHGFAFTGALAWVVATVFQDSLPQRVVLMSELENEVANTVLVALGLMAIGVGFVNVVDEAERSLESQRARADGLLLNVLPPSIAERLKSEPGARIADRHDEVTVLFADLVGFTELSARLSAAETVALLNEVFTELDAICERAGVEKVRTIGDGYMAVCGAPTPRADHAEVLTRVAIEIRDYVADRPAEEPIAIRIGLESGAAVAAIVGSARFHYDLWGDAVNVAARMESLGEPGRIQIGRGTWERVHRSIPCEARGPIAVKGKGELETWFVL